MGLEGGKAGAFEWRRTKTLGHARMNLHVVFRHSQGRKHTSHSLYYRFKGSLM